MRSNTHFSHTHSFAALLCVICTLLFLLLAASPAGAASSATVSVALGVGGEVVAHQAALTVTDQNNNGQVDIDDALQALDDLCWYGEGSGYAAEKGDYGLAISRLWGEENGSFGYYLNHKAAQNLEETLKDGDEIYAFVYQDQQNYSDRYAYFSEVEGTLTPGQEKTLALKSVYFDQDWQEVSQGVAGAKIVTKDGEILGTTDEKGYVTFTLTEPGTYAITALSPEALILTPTLYTLTVQKEALPLEDTLSWCKDTPAVYGSEWYLLALYRNLDPAQPNLTQAYVEGLSQKLADNDGSLSSRKYTEYCRVVLTLTAMHTSTTINGVDLLKPLLDEETVSAQGINGPIWALLALDSANREAEVKAHYLAAILAAELPAGGWAMTGETADPDVTAMALQALAPYRENKAVAESIDKGLDVLSQLQLENGGYSSFGTENCESTCQVLMALCELGISLDDPAFVKNGNSLLDALLAYRNPDKGFAHLPEGESNAMATQQAACAMIALDRAEAEVSGFFRMENQADSPLFYDIEGLPQQAKIEALAEAKILNGRGNNLYLPEETMTRAEFSVLLSRALSLPAGEETPFLDLTEDWYQAGVASAYQAGIIKGRSETTFAPQGEITCQEARIMLDRAAALLEVETSNQGLSNGKRPITRAEVAEQMYDLLMKTGKLQ